jgi:hypothetical protein
MDLSGCDDRFLASIVLGWPDYDAQLYAIRDVLRWHGRAADELSNEIKAIGAFSNRHLAVQVSGPSTTWSTTCTNRCFETPRTAWRLSACLHHSLSLFSSGFSPAFGIGWIT